ncbi:hypothetical protein [Pseudomonas oryzihabitans]|uniref:hypothetical protein n=1 Tax=Pseudomonas oryzihabitans TaxID=47885 RepID=UPI00286590BF|nr:hypothetical protein [Pseudomonas psychrotolerans]MDR6678248.1 hypothetical protein [Pseudomonas psychrotolerans]
MLFYHGFSFANSRDFIETKCPEEFHNMAFSEHLSILEWIVFTESLSFEQLEFSTLQIPFAENFLIQESEVSSYTTAWGGRRLLLGQASSSTALSDMATPSDVVCIRLSLLAQSSCRMQAILGFNRLSRLGIRTCLLLTANRNTACQSTLDRCAGALRLKWTQREAEGGIRHSGIAWSHHWKPGIAEHALNQLERFRYSLNISGSRT